LSFKKAKQRETEDPVAGRKREQSTAAEKEKGKRHRRRRRQQSWSTCPFTGTVSRWINTPSQRRFMMSNNPNNIIDLFCVLCGRWKDVQEAASSLREGASGRGAEAGGRVRTAVQEGALEGAVRPQPYPQQRA